MFQLHVVLASGRGAAVSLSQSSTVFDLEVAAQEALGQRFLKLIGPGGRLLYREESLQEAGFEEGDAVTVTAVTQRLHIWRHRVTRSFCGGPEVATLSLAANGFLRCGPWNVQQIQATMAAFAALRLCFKAQAKRRNSRDGGQDHFWKL